MSNSHKADIKTYREKYKEFKRLAKTADQRLREIKNNYSKRPNFENMINWAYRKAMKDIKSWSGEEAHTFDRDVPKQQTEDFTLKQLKAKINDIKSFLNMPTSTISGTISVYQKRADSLNNNPDIQSNFTWEELATVFEDKENNDFYQKGGVSYLKAVGYIKDNEAELLKSLEDNSRLIVRTGNRKANKMAKDMLKKYGLDFTKLYRK